MLAAFADYSSSNLEYYTGKSVELRAALQLIASLYEKSAVHFEPDSIKNTL